MDRNIHCRSGNLFPCRGPDLAYRRLQPPRDESKDLILRLLKAARMKHNLINEQEQKAIDEVLEIQRARMLRIRVVDWKGRVRVSAEIETKAPLVP